MINIKSWLLCLLGLGVFTVASAHINPKMHNQPNDSNQQDEVTFREEDCDAAIRQIDQAVNNVRARLTTGGDVWWDGTNGRYIVPKVPAGEIEVSSIFAGAVWLGGVDPGGGLKVAAQTYGRSGSGGGFDFWPGPLTPPPTNEDDPPQGTTNQETCADWDKIFTVTEKEIDLHLSEFSKSITEGTPYGPEDIPLGVKGWPGKGNPYFVDVHGFKLPSTSQGLAGFWDLDGDDVYDPLAGDYPIIEIRGCAAPQYPTEMNFWIYNDAGNIHTQTNGNKIQMEVQVQAFAYARSDEINDMTFQRYKLINRAVESIDSMFFAMWVDPDLGCHTDDYIGCDTARSMAYVYNEDVLDGSTGCTCDQGAPTYCESIPMLGVDYFRGPLDEFGRELGMSSFTYYNNGGVGDPPQGTTDPNNAQEYYRYLSGSWRDGLPFTFGDDAYDDGDPIKYAFTEPPNDENGWSMCSANLYFGDRRTVQASGPFRLDPGAVNELIIGVAWVPDQIYPCPSIRKLQEADDIAQGLFDNCFDILDGPDAPDVDFIELDQEIIAVFTNNPDTLLNNNAEELYKEGLIQDIPADNPDSFYVFEGYQLYQLSSSEVQLGSSIDDPDKVRLIYQVDVKNNIAKVFNWEELEEGIASPIVEVFVPELKVEGENAGVRHVFSIKEDRFTSSDDVRLVNHKKYYFVVVAYGHNEYLPFDPDNNTGQRKPYIQGGRNVGADGDGAPYVVIPRPIVDRKLNAEFGDGAVITRLDGIGTGTNNFLDISDESREAIEESFSNSSAFNGEISYRPGRGPLEVKIFNPLDVKNGEFELSFFDSDLNDDSLDVDTRWKLVDLKDPNNPVISAKTIERFNEEVLKEYGFVVAAGQVAEPGERTDKTNGAIGYEIEYTAENAEPWFFSIPDDLGGDPVFNFVHTGKGEVYEDVDPDQALTTMGGGGFVPYTLTFWGQSDEENLPYLTPCYYPNLTFSNSINPHARVRNPLGALNNVDIVLTSNKDLWSRCVVVESANNFYTSVGGQPEGNATQFSLRESPSVTKFDSNNDGFPDPDPDAPEPVGMGWFPGYAIDVETGQRLNIFFGENSIYDGQQIFPPDAYEAAPTGSDMMFNPAPQAIVPGQVTSAQELILLYYMGGQHYIYVTRYPYDECAYFADRFSGNEIRKRDALKYISWAALPLPTRSMNTYQEGLVPEDVILKLRVNNPYQVESQKDYNEDIPNYPITGSGDNSFHGLYRFKIDSLEAEPLTSDGIENALDLINVVPNPYYGFSDYEGDETQNYIKITNLPPQCIVTIYSLDGKFIRQYNRDEIGENRPEGHRAIARAQVNPDIVWDLKNSKQIPVASGVYLMHIDAEGLGQRTIKWFGINRQFDPSKL